MTDAALTNAGAELLTGYVPGAIGRVAELHALYYGRHWDFGLCFEAQVATGLSEFLQRLDPGRDGFWTVCRDGCVQGAVAIDGSKGDSSRGDGSKGDGEGAHLRWFILAEELRGQGMGSRLLGQAVDFCARCGHRSIFLWTFHGLGAARHLYEKHGFRLMEEREGDRWGKRVLEQRFVLDLT